MISNIQIISDFRLAMEMRHELEPMVTFKGVPVICKVRITQIDGETVTLVTHDPLDSHPTREEYQCPGK